VRLRTSATPDIVGRTHGLVTEATLREHSAGGYQGFTFASVLHPTTNDDGWSFSHVIGISDASRFVPLRGSNPGLGAEDQHILLEQHLAALVPSVVPEPISMVLLGTASRTVSCIAIWRSGRAAASNATVASRCRA
jgi:hypothetical protein